MASIEDETREAIEPRHGELLERVAHELKNPMAVLQATLEYLEVELVGHDEAIDAVRDATTASVRLITIASDLEILARLANARSTAGERVTVRAVVAAAVENAVVRARPKGIDVSYRVTVDCDVTGTEHLLVRGLVALIDASSRGLSAGANIVVEAADDPASSEHVVVAIGVRGAADVGPAAPAASALAAVNLGVYTAIQIVAAHGGTTTATPTGATPRLEVRLPKRVASPTP